MTHVVITLNKNDSHFSFSAIVRSQIWSLCIIGNVHHFSNMLVGADVQTYFLILLLCLCYAVQVGRDLAMGRNPYSEFYQTNANKTQKFGSGRFRRHWAVAQYNAKVNLTL